MKRRTNCYWCDGLFARDSTNLCFFCELVNVKSKHGIETGTIDKVNRTRAVVNINGKLWNVPFSLITKTERENNETND